MGSKYVKTDENKKYIHFDANNLYGRAITQSLH